MKPFLSRIADHISEHYGEETASLCVVLPNRRAGLYLKKYLGEKYKKTIWAPEIYSIEDFIIVYSGYRLIDPAGLLFELFDIHTELAGEAAQPFETFASWGQVLLSDFNEIDLYLAEPQKVFTFLNELKALSVWNPGEKNLTAFQKNYLEFYNSLYDYYSALSARLIAKRSVYPGLAYRKMAETITDLSQTFTWKKIIFAGLNALTHAEEKIIDHLLLTGKAEIFWDADRYYLDQPLQEAGVFLSGYLKKWPSDPVRWIEDNFRGTEKKITITGVPRNVGQAKMAGQILKDLSTDKDAFDRTAIVLADENLLIPVLNSLPDNIMQFNITMGYPISNCPLYQLFRQLFQMNENSERFREKRKAGDQSVYVNDIIRILVHPYLSAAKEDAPETGKISLSMISNMVRSSNRVFLSEQSIYQYFEGASDQVKQLAHLVFPVWLTPEDALNKLMALLEFTRDRFISLQKRGEGNFAIDLEYLFLFSKIIRRVRSLLDQYKGIRSLHSLRKVMFQVLDTTTLPFYGEPLKGVQVMGVLETRALDFDHVIMLSVNEGIIPSGRSQNTFIPYEVKNEFGLPTYRDRDSVYAYHFYRLLQRAGHIHLLYDTEGDALGGGEKSRFITQILHELHSYNSNLRPVEQILSIPPTQYAYKTDVVISKTEEVMAILKDRAARGFSPSHLSTYINCSLQFYFQVVAGLAEVEEVEETIEASTLGTVIHDVLRQVYRPFENKNVSEDLLRKSLESIEGMVAHSFSENYKEGDIYHGKNYLIFKVAEFLVSKMIDYEIRELENNHARGDQLTILSIEQFFNTSLFIGIDKSLEVKLKGKIDRVDRYDGITRIIDYKSGYVSPTDLRIRNWEDLTIDPKKSKALQLLIYAFLFSEVHHQDGFLINPGIFALRSPSKGLIPLKINDEVQLGQEHFTQARMLLTNLLEEIFNNKIPFTQTPVADHCIYCAFKIICNRQ